MNNLKKWIVDDKMKPKKGDYMKKLSAVILLAFTLFATLVPAFAKQKIDPNADKYTEVHALHILTRTKNQSKAVIMRVNNGESFKQLARQFSNCPSGKVGGDLGWFQRGQMVPEFEKAAFETPIGKMSDPVQTEFGWHVIKVIDKR